MNPALDADHELIADGVRAVCARFDDAYWRDCDSEHRFPWKFYDALAAGGWVGIALPEQYGGGGKGITEAAIVLHEIADQRSGDERMLVGSSHVFGLNPVVKFGNDRLRRDVPAASCAR